MDWLDEQLGRITMYRLVVYSLLGLTAMAIVLMLAGNLSYSPLLFLLSIAVLVGVSYGSNRIFGWLFGIKPHSESAIITGLILALLFVPPTTLIGFVKIAIIAVIAMASKYILVIRGRHVFNPAAIAIVIGSISGLAYAGWWVATPGMIPVTILAGILILRRTKKQYVSLTLVAAAVVSLLIQGTDPVTALVSWPLLFIGAIMFTEPLTLPPRAKQQYIIAVVVGVLMTIPFHYAKVTMTPALALVIGNGIAWWFGQRRTIKLRYVGKKQMGSDTYDFSFDTRPLTFEPGQYIELTVPHARADSRGIRRVFSIVAKPGDEQISIGTKLPQKPSSFKRALMTLKPGDTVYATRINGDFVLPEDKTTPITCIAGGIGVTPFVSYLLSSQRKLQLIYSVGSVGELSYVDQLRQHAIAVTVVSPNESRLPDSDWQHEPGKLTTDMLKKRIDVSANPTVYVSGPPAMVMSVKRMLKEIGVRTVKTDEFSGY